MTPVQQSEYPEADEQKTCAGLNLRPPFDEGNQQRALRAQGKPLIEATIEAAYLRFRPILMTSLAFILGVVPLVIASGASAKSQQALGTGVLGGMITATVLAIFWVPVFFVVVMRIFGRRKSAASEQGKAAVAA